MVISETVREAMMDELLTSLTSSGQGEISFSDVNGLELATPAYSDTHTDSDYSGQTKKIIFKSPDNLDLLKGQVSQDGRVASFSIKNGNDDVVIEGTVTDHMGDGDIKFSRTVWSSGQQVTIEQLNILF